MALADFPSSEIIIGGKRIGPEGRVARPIKNPAAGAEPGTMPAITPDELAESACVLQAAFLTWNTHSSLDPRAILSRFTDLLRRDMAQIARDITLDMGKPLAEALAKVRSTADHVDFHAEEGRRVYGRIIPARIARAQQLVTPEPVGVCPATPPWSFPLSQSIRKLANARTANILRNAGQVLRAGLLSALERAAADRPQRLILTGTGRNCVAGADARQFDGPQLAPHLNDVLARLIALPFPTIAAINGAALGGSLEIALVGRYRIASPRASAGLPEVTLGLVPGAGGTQQLPRLTVQKILRDIEQMAISDPLSWPTPALLRQMVTAGRTFVTLNQTGEKA